jgi:tRNA C32,U32 (ribose-2'-O)-methylase TrmJ
MGTFQLKYETKQLGMLFGVEKFGLNNLEKYLIQMEIGKAVGLGV